MGCLCKMALGADGQVSILFSNKQHKCRQAETFCRESTIGSYAEEFYAVHSLTVSYEKGS